MQVRRGTRNKLQTGQRPVLQEDREETPMFRRSATLVAVVLLSGGLRPPLAFAQQVTLAETPASGECFRCSVELDLVGKMFITQDGNKETVRLEAKARHVFSERTLTVAEGLPAKSA